MKKSKKPILYGVSIAILLIAYFLLLSAMGQHTNPLYSLVNGPIMAIGMYYALKAYKNEKGENFKYDKGYTAAIFTGFNATLLFTLFFGAYGAFLYPGYFETLMGNWSDHYHTSPALLLFEVFIMGMATTIVLSLTLMQWFKRSWNLSYKNA